MTVTPIGQSGYVIRTALTEIIIDPYLSDIVNEVANRPRVLPVPFNPQDIRADAVICTHDHLDHLDAGAVPSMRDDQFFITTNEGVQKLKTLGKNNAIPLNEGETVTVGDVNITAVFADHTVEAIGLIVKADGQTLYFSGDTLYNEKLFETAKYRPDVTFICINGRLGNMNVKEALTVAEKIGAKVNVPAHYDMFESNSENPSLFSDCINGGKTLEFTKEYDVAELLK